MASGPVYVRRSRPVHGVAEQDIERHEVEHELSRLDAATSTITDDLLTLATRVEREIDSRLAEVFGAHQLMLSDPSLRAELNREIEENLVCATTAVKAVFLRWERRFLLMESEVSREKGDDIRDISIRLRNALAGIKVHPLEDLPPGFVLATRRLLPSDAHFLSGRELQAVLLESGSIGSHAALFIREIGLPSVSALPDLLGTVGHHDFALVDADTGAVILDPDDEQKAAFHKKVEAHHRATRKRRERAFDPAVTADGVSISVLANVGCRDDTERAMQNGSEGVGLYRTEQAYLGRLAPPSCDELLEEMRRSLEPAKGHSVCVRLLDIGADKPLPFMRFMAETNPSLGRRGIRYLREFPELLKTHLTAVLELARDFQVRVLVPMVTLPDDVAVVRKHVVELGAELNESSLPQIGAMIETPAAALSARAIAKHAEFLSFGTNDLTQYAFAADRDNAAVGRYFNDSADPIFKLLRITHRDAPHMPLSICGELGSRPEHIPALLRSGIRTFSVAPPLVPTVKEAIRSASCAAA